MTKPKYKSIILRPHEVRRLASAGEVQVWRAVRPQPMIGASLSEESLRNGQPKRRGKYEYWGIGPDDDPAVEISLRPFCFPGERRWVRETFWLPLRYETAGPPRPSICKGLPIHYAADGNPPNTPNRTYPKGLRGGAFAAPDPYCAWFKWASSTMPRWASRLDVEVVSVRVARVQEIGIDDAIASGIHAHRDDRISVAGEKGTNPTTGDARSIVRLPTAIINFADTWDSHNPRTPWSSRPWAWVCGLKRVTT